jgi:hypothetical protein
VTSRARIHAELVNYIVGSPATQAADMELGVGSGCPQVAWGREVP